MFSLFKRVTPQMGLWLLVLGGCVILQLSGMQTSLRFDRAAIAAGEWYRLLTASFVHLNERHMFMNVLGLVLIGVFFSRYLKLWLWLLVILLSSLVVTLGLYWLNPSLHYYVGLSGVLHALLAVASVQEIKRFPVAGWLLLTLLVAKLLWEQMYGALSGSEQMIGGRVIVDAHLYGFISGQIVLIVQALAKMKKKF